MDPISAGIAAAAQLFKGISGFFASRSEAKAQQRAAQQAGQEAGVAASAALTQGDQVAAQGAVQAAANGGGLVGSSIAAIQSLSQQAMVNARAAAYRGVTEVQNHLYDAKVAKRRGVVNLVGSLGAAGADVYQLKTQNDNRDRLMAALTPAGPRMDGTAAPDLQGLY